MVGCEADAGRLAAAAGQLVRSAEGEPMDAPLRAWRRRLSTWGARLPPAVVATSALIAGCPGVAAAQASGDSVAVRGLVEAYRTTWNGHDASDLAAFFTQDADMIMGSDPIALGRGAIEAWWRDYFARQEPERHVAIDVQALRLITPDVAVLNVTTTTGGRSAQGEELPSRKARGTWVVVLERGTWRIAAMRGMPTEQDRIIRGAGRPGGAWQASSRSRD